jgi:acetyl esterase/lipase
LNPDARALRDRLIAAGAGVTFHEAAGQLHVYPLHPTRAGRQARATIAAELRAALQDRSCKSATDIHGAVRLAKNQAASPTKT